MGKLYVNAHINNISFPKTIDELIWYIEEHGCFNVEDILEETEYVEWTVPRYSAIGDIVLFFHAKTAIQWIRKLETAAKKIDDNYYDKRMLLSWLQRARSLYSKYGGKIFAIGRIQSAPKYDNWGNDDLHWSSKIFSNVGDLYFLDNPVDISEFKDFIMISRQSAITPLPGYEFEELKKLFLKQTLSLIIWINLLLKITNYLK